MYDVDVLVIGAGPAGLAAGSAIVDRGCSVLVLERGKPSHRRDRARAQDLVCGVGGAGLYSDGKFSFAPSATALWTLEPHATLLEAYGWAVEHLAKGGLEPPAFPEPDSASRARMDAIKQYPSQYMSLEARIQLIAELESHIGDRLIAGVDAVLTLDPVGVVAKHEGGSFRARAAVLASGRFGPMRYVGGLSSKFRRVEIGMRVEQNASQFALDAEPVASLLDPKWIRRSPDDRLEWRTFCCCRRGEVVETHFDDIATVSGRADGPPTNRSNVGLNVRFLDADEATEALARVTEAASEKPLRLAAAELLSDPSTSLVAQRLGTKIADALFAGLNALAADLRTDLSDSVLHLPAIEGVGYYPPVDLTLKAAPDIWAAGDATGVFRGLVPALVSGRLAAMSASDSLVDFR